MSQTPFNRIAHTSRRQNKVLSGLVVLAMILAAGLFWGSQRLIDQERSRFTLDFLTLVGYAQEQETFLHQLRHQSGQLTELPVARLGSLDEIATLSARGARLFEGRESVVGMPFSMWCDKDCPNARASLFPLGSYLADFYSSFWASSYFPASPVFLINQIDDISVSVPAVNVSAGYESLGLETYRTVVAAVRERLNNSAPTTDCQWQPGDKPTAAEAIWFRAPALPNRLIGLIPAGLSPNIWRNYSKDISNCYYAVTLLNRSRVGVLERAVNPAPRHIFWLQRDEHIWLSHKVHGLLMGQGEPPAVDLPGLHYTLSGLVFKVVDKSGSWAGYYSISYVSFFQDNLWLPLSVLIMLLLGTVSGLAYLRWYNQRVILPAQEAQHEILESDEFNRTLIQTAPVALCLIDRADSHLVFGNALALDWLGATVGERLPDTVATNRLLEQVFSAQTAGAIEQLDMAGGRILYVAYAPTRYMQRDVILFAFADVSARAEIERQLARAKAAADEASAAKSTFLATMSHEIRTPLYGALGTLELLATTRLDRQQRQYVDRIDDASKMLLQLISNILDVGKIEAGQLRLDKIAFNPRELVQSCTGTYAAMAYNKGLLLFSVVDPKITMVTFGDAVHIRQILNNLISNAIKFTEFGHVIVRLTLVDCNHMQTRLRLEVCDSGIGISKAHQTKLFTPFYLIKGGGGSLGGAGLGLSICQRLANLMGAEIQVNSEPRLGSKFSMNLDLAVTELPDAAEPQLEGATVLVQSPHPELTENICAWLRQWGARAVPARDCLLPGNNETILLNVQRSSPEKSNEWQGPILTLYLSGEIATSADVDAYSLSSIGNGIGQFLHDKPLIERHEKVLPQFHIRVLVAEDHPLNQLTLQGQLELLGCEVQLAADGEEALARWDSVPYDLLLTDVNMPYLSGYDLARKLRSEGATLPIIGVTANAMLDEEQRCVDAGMNAWLVKPIELRTLIDILRKYARSDHNQADSNDDRDFKGVNLNVLDKHRDIFLSTMAEDMRQLEQGMEHSNADKVATALHRMRSALALAHHRTLAAQMEVLEVHMQTQGLDEQGQARMPALIVEIRQVLNNIIAST